MARARGQAKHGKPLGPFRSRSAHACKAAGLRLGLVPDPRQMAVRNLVRRSRGGLLGGAPNAEGIDRHETRPEWTSPAPSWSLLDVPQELHREEVLTQSPLARR